jgi:cysteine-rich repeat protein
MNRFHVWGRPRLQAILAFLLAASLLAPGARGSTFVLIEPEEHARAADAVVVGWVTSVESLALADGRIETQVGVWVEDAVKGVFPSGSLTLRQPGGRVGDAVLEIHGAPSYALGERVMLFLDEHPDGGLRPSHLAMGKFRIVSEPGTGRVLAERDFGRSRVLARSGAGLAPASADAARGPWALDSLLTRIRSATVGSRPGVFYPSFAPSHAGVEGSQLSAFTLFPNPARWFEPDGGMPVGIGIDVAGDVDLGQPASRDAVIAGMDAWSDLPDASIELIHAGDVVTPTSIGGCDGLSHVMFDDPFNEIGAPVGCGGTLALGGGCSTSAETIEIGGTLFARRTEGDVTFADGFGPSCAFKDPCNFAEVAAHEMGHVIGLDHSSDSGATMFDLAQFDGRCASLAADDVAGAEFVYPLTLIGCGDGVLDPGEQCDDDNTLAGDGCSQLCEVEPGFTCVGVPSACAPVCPDGLVRGDEACDDGNGLDGDGCSSSCSIEAGFACSGEPSNCSEACPSTPAGTCTALGPGGRALLFLKDDDADGPSANDRVVFQWVRGPALAQSDFGNPLDGGGHHLCLYEDDGSGHRLLLSLNAPDGLLFPSRWSEIRGRGYKYVDGSLSADGIVKLIAKGGDAGRSKWIVIGKGSALPLAGVLPPSPSASGWLVETRSDDASSTCLQATFDAASDVIADKDRPGVVRLLRLRTSN